MSQKSRPEQCPRPPKRQDVDQAGEIDRHSEKGPGHKISSPANCRQQGFCDTGGASEQLSVQMVVINSIAALQRDTALKTRTPEAQTGYPSNSRFFMPAFPSRDQTHKVLHHTVVF